MLEFLYNLYSTIMSRFKIHLCLLVISILGAIVCQADISEKLSLGESVCQLVRNNLIASNPWADNSIVFEPITRGRLTVWTGSSTLPTSECECDVISRDNSSSAVILHFSSFVNKLEWTFFDLSKGATHFGYSVNHQENVKFLVQIDNRKKNSYLDCNIVKHIEQLESLDETSSLQTVCQDCTQYALNMVKRQMDELNRFKLRENLIDNLYWQLTQIMSNQHFNSPTPLFD